MVNENAPATHAGPAAAQIRTDANASSERGFGGHQRGRHAIGRDDGALSPGCRPRSREAKRAAGERHPKVENTRDRRPKWPS
jgi:hypothetical protein